jgi:hypothetical protein
MIDENKDVILGPIKNIFPPGTPLSPDTPGGRGAVGQALPPVKKACGELCD